MATQKPKRVVIKKTRQTFSQEHKVGFVLVAGMGGLAFILGGLYLLRHLASPFDFNYSGPQVFFAGQEEALAIEKQKITDTDGDGLMDYDEVYIHKTSPYLKDSDGDGYTDSAEITIGTDPNCKGEECESTDNLVAGKAILGVDEVVVPVMPNTSLVDETSSESEEMMITEETAETLLSLSTVEKRQMLLAGGLEQAEVDALTDDQVITLFEEVVKQIQSGQTAN